MLKHLISLVFLLIVFNNQNAYSDTNSTILPKIKPEKILTLDNKEKLSKIKPLKKPKIIKKILSSKTILPKSKPTKKNNIKISKKIENKTTIPKPKIKPKLEKETASKDLINVKVDSIYIKERLWICKRSISKYKRKKMDYSI